MNCPSCKNALGVFIISEVKVYVCEKGCGGLWFNRVAIKIIPRCPDTAGRALLIIGQADGVRSFRDVEHICPQCESTLLYRHFFSKEHDLEVDQCSKCGGLWIDFGRKNLFRKYAHSGEKFYMEKWHNFEGVLREKFENMKGMHPDLLESRDQILQVFRFISPERK